MPTQPDDAFSRRLENFIMDLSILFPCEECASHFREYLAKHPPITSSRIEFETWLCAFHNAVNKFLNKPQFPCENLEERWGDCGCEDKDADGHAD